MFTSWLQTPNQYRKSDFGISCHSFKNNWTYYRKYNVSFICSVNRLFNDQRYLRGNRKLHLTTRLDHVIKHNILIM